MKLKKKRRGQVIGNLQAHQNEIGSCNMTQIEILVCSKVLETETAIIQGIINQEWNRIQ
jgi:uncharacterized membrane protein